MFDQLEAAGRIKGKRMGRNGAMIYRTAELRQVVDQLFGIGAANDIDDEFSQRSAVVMATKRRSRSKALIKLPRNMRPKPLAGGGVAYFFELPPYARPKVVGKGRDRRRIPAVRHDKPCPVDSQALGTNLARRSARPTS
jgi:hypothetical protein